MSYVKKLVSKPVFGAPALIIGHCIDFLCSQRQKPPKNIETKNDGLGKLGQNPTIEPTKKPHQRLIPNSLNRWLQRFYFVNIRKCRPS